MLSNQKLPFLALLLFLCFKVEAQKNTISLSANADRLVYKSIIRYDWKGFGFSLAYDRQIGKRFHLGVIGRQVSFEKLKSNIDTPTGSVPFTINRNLLSLKPTLKFDLISGSKGSIYLGACGSFNRLTFKYKGNTTLPQPVTISDAGGGGLLGYRFTIAKGFGLFLQANADWWKLALNPTDEKVRPLYSLDLGVSKRF
jgi:hypothetical protein